MCKKILFIIIWLMPMAAIAGRHTIARDEATNIVNARFAQFYRDEANRRQVENDTMNQEIQKALDIEAAMLRDLTQHASVQIISADELEGRSQENNLLNIDLDNQSIDNHLNESISQNTRAQNPRVQDASMQASRTSSRPKALQESHALSSIENNLQANHAQLNHGSNSRSSIEDHHFSQDTSMQASRTRSHPIKNNAQHALSSIENNLQASHAQLNHRSNSRSLIDDHHAQTINGLSNRETHELQQTSGVAHDEHAGLASQNLNQGATGRLNDSNQSTTSSTFFDTTRGTHDNNPFLFLQELQHAEPHQQIAGIQEVIDSLENLPQSDKLAEEFYNDLTKISPPIAAQFLAQYQKNTKLKTKKPKGTINNNNSKQEANKKIERDSQSTAKKKSKVNHQSNPKDQKNTAQELQNQITTFNTVTNYNFSPNKLYQIYTAPNKVTVIELAPGEKIINTPICGDLIRWKINVLNIQGHILQQYLTVQPLMQGMHTSITIATNYGRLYVLEAHSLANNYMSIVRWTYE